MSTPNMLKEGAEEADKPIKVVPKPQPMSSIRGFVGSAKAEGPEGLSWRESGREELRWTEAFCRNFDCEREREPKRNNHTNERGWP